MDTKLYEDLADKRSIYYKHVSAALDIVREFLIRKKRILYGGMALDICLKLAGHEGIYKDGIMPDYDFMSPDFYNDSNELAVILHNKGLPNISSIRAVHYSSRRVRVNFVPVADITYVPQAIYDIIPTIVSEGMRVVHPDFQRMDMHRAFSTPFEKPPGEVITQRLKKDIKRFIMIDQMYPIREVSVKTPKVKISCKSNLLEGTVLGGVVAYAILYQIHKVIAQKLGEEFDVLPVEIKFGKTVEVTSHIPYFNIITDDADILVGKLKKKSKVYRKYMDDLRPTTTIVDHYEIYNNLGRLLPVYNLNVLKKWGIKLDFGGYIAMPQYVLLYFLLKYFESGHDWYLKYYSSLVNMIIAAEKLAVLDRISNSNVPHLSYEDYPFFLTANCYGRENHSPDYTLSLQERLSTINRSPLPEIYKQAPFGFYPERKTEWPEYDINSGIYAIDGSEIKDK